MQPLQLADANQPITVIGLMSGTSVDAVDACAARLWMENQSLRHEILGTYTYKMPEHLRKRLLDCMRNKPVLLKELCSLDAAVGVVFAEAVYGVLNKNGIKREAVTALASHGQTLFHLPPKVEGTAGNTLQIGNPAVLTEQTGIRTISNFRIRDMAVGGQGAPLVCLADQLLFQHEQIGRAVQNIGGIANVTVLPPKAQDAPIIAFDTGPGNMLIDGAVQHFFGQPYDDSGKIAATGTVNQPMLTHLLDHSFFDEPPPKSTGRELFGGALLDQLLSQFSQVPKEDFAATLTYFTAKTIADAYERFVFPITDISEMIIGGGGVYNLSLRQFITDCFHQNNRQITLKTHQDYGIPDQYKEALAFAILGWTTLTGQPGNVPSCTGAARPVVLGQITP